LAQIQDLLAQALEALRTEHDPHRASELVGQASNRLGSLLYCLRQAGRR
jgi:hypothetical protein